MAIAEDITQLADIKAEQKQALIDKGQTPADDWTTYATLIEQIQTGEALSIGKDDFDYLLYRGDEKMKLFKYLDMSACTTFTYFMNECKNDETGKPLTTIDLRGLGLEGTSVDNGNYSFNACTNCTTLILPEEEWDIRATNYMFGSYKGSKVTNIEKLGDDSHDTKQFDHRNMFRGSGITECDLGGLTAKVASLNMWQNCFYQCSKLRKVWIPSTCINIACNGIGYAMFNGSNTNIVIFTDNASQPATWTGLWNYYNASTPLDVRYGSTHAEYEAY